MTAEENRKLTGEETAAFMNDVLERTILPHVRTIAEVCADGDVAIVFHEVDATKPHVREFVSILRRSETGPVVRLTRSRARVVFRALDTQDPDFYRWATTKRDHVRILVVIHAGSTLCVNNVEGEWGFEPGTLDTERRMN